ncbi:MAG: DUF4112 domain-containing protein [Acidimicrobiia bacterium]
MKYNSGMEQVRSKEQQAELIAHVLDDAIRLPGTSIRFGTDPIVGLIPVVGDVLAVLTGVPILLIARQLRVPANDLIRMAYNQLLNGLIGAIPVVGDFYSFGFKSHAKNSALLVRTVKQGHGEACQIAAPSLSLLDIGVVFILTAPIALVVGLVSWWLWQRDISLIRFFFVL